MAPLPTDSWLFTATSREALYDELVKIGEDAEHSKGLKNALKHIAVGTAGVGAGALAGHGITKLVEHVRPGTIIPKKPVPGPHTKIHQAIRYGLPIGAGLSATLWSRYRQKMHDKLHGKASDDRRS